MWRPPLITSPLFWPAAIATAAGLVGWVLMSWLVARRGAQAMPVSTDKAMPAERTQDKASRVDRTLSEGLSMASASPTLDAMQVEAGAGGRSMELLGRRLREAIRRQEIEPELLQAVEWTLDRHHARAIRHLKRGMAPDEQLAAQASHLFGSLSRASGSDQVSDLADANSRSQRLARLILAISPEFLQTCGIDGHTQNVACGFQFRDPRQAASPHDGQSVLQSGPVVRR